MRGNIATTHRQSTSMEQRKLTEAYSEWVSTWMEEGCELYIMSFMFKPIRGSEATQLKIMEASLEAFYASLVTRVVRRPHSVSSEALPRLLAHPDLPVQKRAKITLRDATINDGLHFQAVIALPPVSRLRHSLNDHLAAHPDLYCPLEGRLDRIHASPVTETPREVGRYTLKMVEKGRFGVEHTVVLPRSLSELGSRR